MLCAGITVYKGPEGVWGAGGAGGCCCWGGGWGWEIWGCSMTRRWDCGRLLLTWAMIRGRRGSSSGRRPLWNLVGEVKVATPDGPGPDVVLLLAVSEGPFQQAADYVRPRGSIICIGLPTNAFLKAPVFDTVVSR